MKLKKITPPSSTTSTSSPAKSLESGTDKALPAKTKRFRFNKKAKILLGVAVVLLVLVLATIIPLALMISPARATLNSAQKVSASFQSQDLVAASQEIDTTRSGLEQVNKNYRYLSWMKVIPLVRNYYLDGQRVLTAGDSGLTAASSLIKAIEPYSDIIGFKAATEGQELEVQSAEERIIFLAQTLDAISPELDSVSNELKVAQEQIDQINPKRYPKKLFGKEVRSRIVIIQNSLDGAVIALTDAKPLIKLLPSLLGQEKPQTYLLLFQNDAELRPTGGFLTAYAYMQVDKGKITPLDSNDIYELDNRFNKNIKAPEIIEKYLDENVWYLRNMNLSPDFKTSMDTFIGHYNEIGGVRRIDGVISIDTQVPVTLLEILGPVGVGGWGNFSAETDPRCDCPQVIYELEEIADRPTYAVRSDRKAVLGPLMHSILANAMGAPKAQWPVLLNSTLTNIKEKHLMFYFPENQESQESAEAFGAAGRILPFDGDYLHINDANFGGAKSNLFVTQRVEQDINLDPSGKATKTLTITYDNPHPASNCNLEAGQLCLNGVLRDVVRVYLPIGSTITNVIGSEVEQIVYEELDKTVVEVFFTLRPQSSSKLVFEYELPGTYEEPYRLLVQKQPGKPNIEHHILFNGQPSDHLVIGDNEILLP